MGVIGNMGTYTQFQTANAISDAAKNPGGTAGMGVGLGAGMAFGNQMAQSMSDATKGGPPPLPQTASYFAVIDGKQAGPFDSATLQSQVGAGKLSRSTLVWKQGMPAWTAAGQVSDLNDLFAAVPPPLPTP